MYSTDHGDWHIVKKKKWHIVKMRYFLAKKIENIKHHSQKM